MKAPGGSHGSFFAGVALWLSNAWTVKDGETIDFPGNDFDSGTYFYLVNPELIVARDTSGELTAYRPGKK